ncbi:S-phase kinase-associated protein 2-like [Penaeus monodon]|uniref:S-phase kinase-associated protein 2-like n=1 Tax=Penaeus monodon TaxID=6687 RepID=UPI0018A7329F|nr:S-phase kinase-associated protein 2-like [Penaeus monodon]
MAAIEPPALEELLSVCFDLKKLSLEHCTINQTICSHIANNPNLDTLNMAMCYGLKHSSILYILTNCKKLVSLNLAWTGLSNEDLRIICRRFPKSLERLNISGCRNTLSDTHVRLLAEQSPGLVELDVSDCTQLTAASVSTIISELRHTEYLAFSRCYTIQPDAYLELKSMPHLLYLDLYGILNESALSTLLEKTTWEINQYVPDKTKDTAKRYPQLCSAFSSVVLRILFHVIIIRVISSIVRDKLGEKALKSHTSSFDLNTPVNLYLGPFTHPFYPHSSAPFSAILS